MLRGRKPARRAGAMATEQPCVVGCRRRHWSPGVSSRLQTASPAASRRHGLGPALAAGGVDPTGKHWYSLNMSSARSSGVPSSRSTRRGERRVPAEGGRLVGLGARRKGGRGMSNGPDGNRDHAACRTVQTTLVPARPDRARLPAATRSRPTYRRALGPDASARAVETASDHGAGSRLGGRGGQ